MPLTRLRIAGGMERVLRSVPPALASCLTCLLMAAPMAAIAQLPAFVELRVPKPPTVATAEGGAFLAYELHVTNFMPQSVTLKKIDVVTAGADRRVLLSLGDSALMRAVTRPGMAPAGAVERLKFEGGTRGVVFIWVPVDARSAPTRLQHRVTLEQGAGDSVRTQELESVAVAVTAQSVAIGPPLRGGVWFAANGPANESGHRRALIPIAGVPSIAQRFAIDYVRMNEADSTFSGDRLKNESYLAEGNDALAVANGAVVAVKDSIPENVPGINSRAVPITLETVGGNHVIIDIGGGYYAFYAHLKPGSLRVKKGDTVKRGQVVGLVGNTGNSTEPHLHFHISDGNSPLGSEGVPYRYDSFEIVGNCRGITGGCKRSAPVTRKGEVPLNGALIRFP
ncbi:MAG TPA: M23 family metallopeptidase [Gemmatimonadaceae bacterium]|nr:M23 family metallopeptidase [Gemmatimonadaceae bacterium]